MGLLDKPQGLIKGAAADLSLWLPCEGAIKCLVVQRVLQMGRGDILFGVHEETWVMRRECLQVGCSGVPWQGAVKRK